MPSAPGALVTVGVKDLLKPHQQEATAFQSARQALETIGTPAKSLVRDSILVPKCSNRRPSSDINEKFQPLAVVTIPLRHSMVSEKGVTWGIHFVADSTSWLFGGRLILSNCFRLPFVWTTAQSSGCSKPPYGAPRKRETTQTPMKTRNRGLNKIKERHRHSNYIESWYRD